MVEYSTIRILLLFLTIPIVLNCQAQSKLKFEIAPESELTLTGKSTVTGFNCELKNNFCGTKQEMTTTLKDDLLHIKGADIDIVIINLDCGNSRLEHDLQGALNADDFPVMKLKILEISFVGGVVELLKNKCTTAQAEITIGEVSKCIYINLSEIVLKDNLLEFKGIEEINMKEFDITPPQVLFGLVKVHEVITINFDLKVEFKI